jgi:hypothetical protein
MKNTPDCHPARPYCARGMCQKCYNAAKWRGDFTPRRRRGNSENLLTYIESRTTLSPIGCMEWTGCRSADGYGRLRYQGKTQIVSRVVLALAIGRPIRDGFQVMHSCDNPSCVNIAHLSEGTTQDNAADMVAKRRQATCDRVGASRLSRADVEIIRSTPVIPHNKSGRSYSALARTLGVSAGTVLNVVKGRSWKSA